ncbi:MAG: response regulator [Candidatus Poseidonia sp.]|jgi:CheY-like chemotaxis protein|uniref:response regulator n=1 Tax=Poseidonia sp. TaxID=2666344 RepID=UPI0030BB48B1|nr:response regulator [Poseidonia sp.]MDG1551930.1 response regulator [Poseidonia sp.]
MGLVTDVNDDAAPTVLIVDNNPMASMRLTNLFKAKNFNIEVCEDGDKAVDEYIRLDPELVVLSLDLPSLDGHLAALEMREHGGEQRIVFVASSRMAELARNAAFSAGAVAWLQKPISSETLEASWDNIIGRIPEAPGLEDLDDLYPEDRVKVEVDEGALLPELPLPLPGALLPELPLPEILVASTASPVKKKSWKKRSIFFLLLVSIAAGAGYYLGYLPV